MSTETKQAYTVQEAAKAYGVSTDTIRSSIKRGDLSAKYPTSRPVLGAKELESWFNSLPDEAPQ
ncbi:hypothetical protein ACTXIU_00660 [Glutamicibacter arilaitensis]|uniref:hypothetical protein n=1 Tax=Glutamicibacter arilaitensis TaxID=256701 RepID=UPI003F914BB9